MEVYFIKTGASIVNKELMMPGSTNNSYSIVEDFKENMVTEIKVTFTKEEIESKTPEMILSKLLDVKRSL